MSGPLTIDDALRDVMYLLVGYPLDSLKLSPWEVAQIFYSYKKNQKHSRRVLTQADDLPAIFQLFSATFGTCSEDLAQYFGSFYQKDVNGQSVMQDDVQVALQSPILSSLLSYKCVKLLSSNEDLIKWEFIRCLGRQKCDMPFLEEVVAPLMTQRNFDSLAGIATHASGRGPIMCRYVLSSDSALNWAIEVACISAQVAQTLLYETCVFSRETSSKYCLTFSAFVIFSLRCIHFKLYGSVSSEPRIDEERAEKTIRDLLITLSSNLTRVQQVMRLKILQPLLGHGISKATLLGKAEREALLSCSITLFDKYTSWCKPVSGEWGFLPPRPPPVFTDAPQMVEFFRFLGIVERSGSLSTTWIAFGNNLSCMRGGNMGWGAYVVPPSPIKLSVAYLGQILSIVCHMCHDDDTEYHTAHAISKEADVAMLELYGSYLCDTIIPVLASYIEKDFFSGVAEAKYTLQMSDLLRYGGARAMSALFLSGMWLEQVFESIAGIKGVKFLENTEIEPSLLLVVKFFSCVGLLKPSTVAVQAKRALHGRFRPDTNAVSKGSVTLSFAEFEELFMRCALCAWADKENELTANDTQIMQTYSSECQRAAREVAGDDAGKTWGVDFVTPYIKTLQLVTTRNLSREEPFATLLGRHPNVKQEFSISQLDNKVSEAGWKDVRLSSPGKPSSPISPLGSIEELVQSVSVQSRAEVLLKDILETRSSSPSHANNILETRSSSPSHANNNQHSNDDETSLDGSLEHSIKEQPIPNSPTRTLLAGTKEALWPVYGTYCSCGDSVDPGKLSGPNLFALLSKLGVLSDNTVLSDIGILLHQISAHTHSSSVSIASATSSETFESPSLSFEEFLVFLCAFAQLRFDGIVSAPILSGANKGIEKLSSANSQNTEVWFQNWKTFMGNSQAFRRLMEEGILPMLRRHPLLAYPQDARHRDNYSPIFSLEVLLAIEGSEEQLRKVFRKNDSANTQMFNSRSAVDVLQQIGLVPNIVSADDVIQLLSDIAPDVRPSRSSSPTSPGSLAPNIFGSEATRDGSPMNFPQWEWVVCVVSFQAVEHAIANCSVPTPSSKISSLVRDFINSIAASISTL